MTSFSPRIKIERAKELIVELESRIRAFDKSDPYTIETRLDPHTGNRIYYAARVTAVPDCISVIAGDVIQNLRSALDHLACRLVEANGNSITRRTSYPIFGSSIDYKAGFKAKVNGMSQAAIDQIHATKPYKGGNDVFWRISELNNIDKHRLLITMIARHCSIDLTPIVIASLEKKLRKRPPSVDPQPGLYIDVDGPLDPLNEGDVLLSPDVSGSESNENIHFVFDIAFNEPRVGEERSLLKTLFQLADFVEAIVTQFEPLC